MKLDNKSFLKHANHEMVVDQRPVAHNTASLRCKRCDKHIKWLSKTELMAIQNIMAPHHGSAQGVKTRPVRESTARHSR